MNIGCSPGADGTLSPVDPCTAFVANQAASAHIIPCEDVDPIP